eukprot:6236365-Alexandrium_andersonii.AAC.1
MPTRSPRAARAVGNWARGVRTRSSHKGSALRGRGPVWGPLEPSSPRRGLFVESGSPSEAVLR